MSVRAKVSPLSAAWMFLAPVPGLLLAGYYEWSAHALSAAGFPLDDAWIHAQFAHSLATGHGFSYTGDRWVAGSTAPAWTLVLALGSLITPQIVIVAKALGLLFQALTGIFAARLGAWLTDSKLVGFSAGLLAAAVPILVWGGPSGMEVPLAACLVLLGIECHLRTRSGPGPRWTGIAWLALASLVRPESLIIMALALADLIWLWFRQRERGREILVASGAAAIVLVPWVIFDYVTIGRPLPTTFYAKSGSGLARALEQHDLVMAQRDLMVFGPQAVTNFISVLADQFGLAVWLIPVGLVWGLITASRRQATVLLLLILIVVPFAMGVTAPQRLKLTNERYVPQLIAIAAVLAAMGTVPVVRLLSRVRYAELAIPILLAAAVAWRAPARAQDFAIGVKNINELHVALGQWINRHLPIDAVVGTNDVGAIAYFGRRRILDLEGLVSPEALEFRGIGRGLRVVETFHPDYLAIFPHWYPEIAAQTDRFRLICRASISDNQVAAGNEFLVLQTPWAREPPVLFGPTCR
jgi:uncharacterized membrane protein